MLHVIVATHGPDTCPAAHKDLATKFMPYMQQIPDIASKAGVTMQGGWADMPGHAIFMVIDAPNAHAVSQFAMELHLMDWNTVDVHAVNTIEQASQKATEHAG